MAIVGTDMTAAAALLRAGEVVAIPTETVYGLAGNGLNPAAIARIYSVKGRPSYNPLILHFGSAAAVASCVQDVPAAARALMEAFWPGPLTLLLPRTARVPDAITAGLPTVAVRVPDHPLTLALLDSLDFPLAAPSANPFGYISPTLPQHVAAQLGDKIPYILDGGPCRNGIESTIVGFPDGVPTIFRWGAIPREAVEAVVGPVHTQVKATERPAGPGMLPWHYSPATPLKLSEAPLLPVDPQNCGVLAFREPWPGIPGAQQRILSPSGNLTEAAARLYALLHELDGLRCAQLFAELLPETGLGHALNDRLRRAAAKD